MHYYPYPGDDAPETERKAWAKRECEAFLYDMEMRRMGIWIPYAGLVYKMPLCHDDWEY